MYRPIVWSIWVYVFFVYILINPVLCNFFNILFACVYYCFVDVTCVNSRAYIFHSPSSRVSFFKPNAAVYDTVPPLDIIKIDQYYRMITVKRGGSTQGGSLFTCGQFKVELVLNPVRLSGCRAWSSPSICPLLLTTQFILIHGLSARSIGCQDCGLDFPQGMRWNINVEIAWRGP